MSERISTGIPGLDELIEGGFPNGSATLVSGGAGTGKTIFCSQYLWHGLENGENGLFVTLEEEPEEIKDDATVFGWDFETYEDKGMFKIMYLNPFKDSGGFVNRIRQAINEIDAERVVVDSTSVMGMYDDSPGSIRERLYDLTRKLRREDVTAVLTSEDPDGKEAQVTRYGVEEFVADALITLDMSVLGENVERTIRVSKMRSTDIDGGEYGIEFTEDGLSLKD